jgi:hypothetical protein
MHLKNKLSLIYWQVVVRDAGRVVAAVPSIQYILEQSTHRP